MKCSSLNVVCVWHLVQTPGDGTTCNSCESRQKAVSLLTSHVPPHGELYRVHDATAEGSRRCRGGGRPVVARHSSAKSFELAPGTYTASSAGGSDSTPSTPAVTPALDASPTDPVRSLIASHVHCWRGSREESDLYCS